MNSDALNCVLSDESDDSEYYSVDSDMETDNLVADAVTGRSKIFIKNLTHSDIQTIDSNIDLYDKVSLVYLLYEDPNTALQQIILLLHNASINIIEEWYRYEKKSNNRWQSKLLEAITIIQNYKILRILGFKKEDMILKYLPLQEVSLDVNIVRKCCYRICEDFEIKRRNAFLQNLEKEFKRNHLTYVPSKRSDYNIEFLEMYFLYLETEKYIRLDDVERLAKIFKFMGAENLYDKFQNLHDKINIKSKPSTSLESRNYNIDKTPGHHHQLSNIPSDLEITDKIEENLGDKSDIYNIHPEHPGILLIINNEDFYTELREEFRDLLPKTDLKFESRTGSHMDGKNLRKTFANLGFDIIEKENKIHTDMLKDIEDVVRNFQHSTLFVAILSHGDEGVVYASNSIPVEVTKIQEIICHKRLSGIPKVLLLQSCQGSEWQKIDEEDSLYERDGPPKKYVTPKTTDLLTFRATIRGYGAVRHKVNGSLFIQTLCELIKENPTDHIQEICRKVIGRVSSIKWSGNKCMVPLMESTFTKRLYLK